MSKPNLSEEEIKRIEGRYNGPIRDVLLNKRLDNIEKTMSWKSVKNNTKSNKFKKNKAEKVIKPEPYMFKKIPLNMKEIIMDLCKKNDIKLQTLAVRSNIQLHIIDNYINGRYHLDNNLLEKILKVLHFDLNEYIKNN